MTPSKATAERVIAAIQAADGIRTKAICINLDITIDQFNGAKPYITTVCEKIKFEWRTKA